MKFWLALIAVISLGTGCDVGGGNLTGTGGGTLATGAGGATVMTGSGGIVTGNGGAGPGGAAGSGEPDPCGRQFPSAWIPPEILIVLDTSSSMNDGFSDPCPGGCGAGSKWAEAVAAIEAVADAADSRAHWGLQLFTNGVDACAAAGVAVPAGPTSATGIRWELSRRSAGGTLLDPGNSPTRAALDAATTQLTQLSARPSSADQAILLVTDGEPECGKAADALASDAAGTVQAVMNARAAGFVTLVAGVGIAPGAETVLSDMARAGGVPRAGSPTYYPVSNASDLVAAMDRLATQMPCTFSVPGPPTTDGRTSRGDIGVLIDGTEIWQGGNDGWSYGNANQDAIHLHGRSCDAARDGGSVSITFHTICP